MNAKGALYVQFCEQILMLTKATHIALVSAIAMMLLLAHFYASVNVVSTMSHMA